MEALSSGFSFNAVLFVGSLITIHQSVKALHRLISTVFTSLGISHTYIQLFTIGARWDIFAIVISSLRQNQTSLAISLITGSMISSVLGVFALGVGLLPRDDVLVFHAGALLYSALLASLLNPFFTIFLNLPARLAGWISILFFLVSVYCIYWSMTKASFPSPFESIGDRRTTNRLEKSLTGLENTRGEAKIDVQQIQGEGSSSKGTPGLQYAHLAIALALLVLGAYAISLASSNLGPKLRVTSSTMGGIVLAVSLNIPCIVQIFRQERNREVGSLMAQTVGGSIFMITVCGGLVFLFGDLNVLESRNVHLSILETTTLHLAYIILLGVQLAGGRWWMGWVMGGLYLVALTVELTWLR